MWEAQCGFAVVLPFSQAFLRLWALPWTMHDHRSRERRRRDQGLAQVSSMSRWMIGGAIVVAGAFSAVFALPHRADAGTEAPDLVGADSTGDAPAPDPVAPTGGVSPSVPRNTPSTTSRRSSADASSSSGNGLSVPMQPPTQTRRRPRAVTGAS